jgi:CheY-like chemotaxis protein
MSRPRVLVVDDCPDTRATLRTLLGLWGFEVFEAADGPAALRAARTCRPGVVLLDLAMPGLDGYEVARRLRRMPDLGGALLIAVSGYGREQDVARAQAAGFDHHLLKPADPEDLERLLTALPSPDPD